MQHRKRGWVLLFLALALMAPALGAATPDEDLTHLSLEELGEVQVLTGDVLGTHTHHKGEWMVGYSFMHMDMGGYRDGTHSLAFDDVLADYRFAAPSMTMDMHMLHIMYAPTDRITLMLMAPYNRNSMEHVEAATGDRFTAKAQGWGDVGFSALFTFCEHEHSRWVFTAGFTAPTGSIESQFPDVGVHHDHPLDYTMRLGSGTWDLTPALSYFKDGTLWNWGAEVAAVWRIGENDHDYSLGNSWRLSGWTQRKLTERCAFTSRLDFQTWGDVDGADPGVHPAWMPANNPDLISGTRADLGVGLSWFLPWTERGGNKGTRLALEIAAPIYQSLDGPQMEANWSLRGGVQWIF